MISALLVLILLCHAFSGCGASAPEEAADRAAGSVEIYIPEDAIAAEEGKETAANSHDGQGRRIPRTDTASYVSFHRSARTYTDDKDRELMVQTLTKPVFYSPDQPTQEWVDQKLREIFDGEVLAGQQLLEAAKEAIGESTADFYSYSHHVSMESRRHDERVLSVISQRSEFSGGAHPYLTQYAMNLDLEQLTTLRLEDVISEGREGELEAMLLQAVEEKFPDIGQQTLFEDYPDIIAAGLVRGSMTECWFFTDKGLTVFYNQYELAPYAAGIISVELSYDNLSGVLEPEYVPEPCKGLAKGISLSAEPLKGKTTYHVDFGGEDTVYISIDGSACSVQLCKVSYVQQTMVKKTMLFSASRIDEDTVIAVTGTADRDAIYEVEYCNDGAVDRVIYIQNGRIMTELPLKE